MKIVRFILPFLFVRNWYNGAWELSTARLITFGALLLLCVLGLTIAYLLQAPITYIAPV